MFLLCKLCRYKFSSYCYNCHFNKNRDIFISNYFKFELETKKNIIGYKIKESKK